MSDKIIKNIQFHISNAKFISFFAMVSFFNLFISLNFKRKNIMSLQIIMLLIN
jgi:hypothetical protein